MQFAKNSLVTGGNPAIASIGHISVPRNVAGNQGFDIAVYPEEVAPSSRYEDWEADLTQGAANAVVFFIKKSELAPSMKRYQELELLRSRAMDDILKTTTQISQRKKCCAEFALAV